MPALTVLGTPGDDFIALRHDMASGQFQVYMNQQLALSVPASTTEQIEIQGLEGNDTFDLSQMESLALSAPLILNGGNGNDRIDGSGYLGRLILLGSVGDDTLIGGRGNDELHGGAGNDLLISGDGNDLLSGGDGQDTLYGGDGDDQPYGGSGNDLLFGGNGRDWMEGGTGNDTLHGEGGADWLYGNDGDDALYGGDGDDSLYGGEGNDSLFDWVGTNRLNGDAGINAFHTGDPFTSVTSMTRVRLAPGEAIFSPNRQFELTLQPDGNLVLYGPGRQALWASVSTWGKSVAAATLQADGNLVLSDNNHLPLWSTGTGGSSSATLALRNDGNLLLVRNGVAIWSTNIANGMPAGSLHLTPGQSATSPNGRFRLTLASDGDLILRGPGDQVLWAAGTRGMPVSRAIMQFDGNLAIYGAKLEDNSNDMLWSTNTAYKSGAALRIQDDGNLALIYQGSVIWSSNTTYGLPAGSLYLTPGQSVFSPNRQYQLTLQTDGNLVLYGPNRQALWASVTSWGKPVAVAVMQFDGNFVIYGPKRSDGSNNPLWSSNTGGQPGATLQLRDDGHLRISNAGKVLWSAGNSSVRPSTSSSTSGGSTNSSGSSSVTGIGGGTGTGSNTSDNSTGGTTGLSPAASAGVGFATGVTVGVSVGVSIWFWNSATGPQAGQIAAGNAAVATNTAASNGHQVMRIDALQANNLGNPVRTIHNLPHNTGSVNVYQFNPNNLALRNPFTGGPGNIPQLPWTPNGVTSLNLSNPQLLTLGSGGTITTSGVTVCTIGIVVNANGAVSLFHINTNPLTLNDRLLQAQRLENARHIMQQLANGNNFTVFSSQTLPSVNPLGRMNVWVTNAGTNRPNVLVQYTNSSNQVVTYQVQLPPREIVTETGREFPTQYRPAPTPEQLQQQAAQQQAAEQQQPADGQPDQQGNQEAQPQQDPSRLAFSNRFEFPISTVWDTVVRVGRDLADIAVDGIRGAIDTVGGAFSAVGGWLRGLFGGGGGGGGGGFPIFVAIEDEESESNQTSPINRSFQAVSPPVQIPNLTPVVTSTGTTSTSSSSGGSSGTSTSGGSTTGTATSSASAIRQITAQQATMRIWGHFFRWGLNTTYRLTLIQQYVSAIQHLQSMRNEGILSEATYQQAVVIQYRAYMAALSAGWATNSYVNLTTFGTDYRNRYDYGW